MDNNPEGEAAKENTERARDSMIDWLRTTADTIERDGWEAAGPRIVIPAMTAFESMRQSWPFRLDSLHLVRNGRHVHFEVDLHHRDAATPTNTPLTTSFTVTGTTDN